VSSQNGYPPKLILDAAAENAMDTVRQVFWNRLRVDTSFSELNGQDEVFRNYVDFSIPRYEDDFQRMIVDVFWELVGQSVISPGTATGNPLPPFFHLTEHGKRCLREVEYSPHDPTTYLKQLGQSVPSPDSTVLAYLGESLECFSRGTMVASVMMLGIASERVFLLICDSLAESLQDSAERTEFEKVLARNAMKPKLDWVSQKFQKIASPKRPADWPDDADIQLTGIFNFIRCERNEVGHPRELPPSVTRDVAYGYLRIFPSYYGSAERVRGFLSKNKV
jgi:hypothetical protein